RRAARTSCRRRSGAASGRSRKLRRQRKRARGGGRGSHERTHGLPRKTHRGTRIEAPGNAHDALEDSASWHRYAATAVRNANPRPKDEVLRCRSLTDSGKVRTSAGRSLATSISRPPRTLRSLPNAATARKSPSRKKTM